MRTSIYLGLVLLAAAPAWGQVTDTADENADTANVQDRMLTPPPVSGQAYSVALDSEERTNLLHYGLAFGSAYSDNVLGAATGHPVSDVSYSAWPTIGMDTSTSRLHWDLTYAPGFTFYQRTSARNEADQNASLGLEYRLSPHVTFSARDSFQKSSNLFNQPDLSSVGGVFGGAQGANFSVIPPVADRLSNFGDVSLTYQFSLNEMIGASGIFSDLHYPNPAEVPGLYDASSQDGSAFYSLRISKMHYVGTIYQYQRLLSYPTTGLNETQTHSIFLFYTIYPTSRLSISFFGGPQYANTVQAPLPPSLLQQPAMQSWTPAGGASLSWQGRFNSLAVSYSHIIAGGGGLVGAVHLDNASLSARQQITKIISGSLAGAYSQNNVLGDLLIGNNGHSIQGTASLQQLVGQHLNLQLGYTRIYQNYSNVAVISSAPNTNREFISLSYQFSRPLGR
jgi:hypothetical protein